MQMQSQLRMQELRSAEVRGNSSFKAERKVAPLESMPQMRQRTFGWSVGFVQVEKAFIPGKPFIPFA